MDSLHIEATLHSPLIYFQPNGNLFMEGRAIPENAHKLFDPLINYVSQLEVSDVVFDINLDYFNTSTSKVLLELLKKLDANSNIDSVLINWHYEEDDEDSIEMAEIYEECLTRADLKYLPHPEGICIAEKLNLKFN